MLLSFRIENFRSIKLPLIVDFTVERRLNEEHLPYNTFEQNGNEILKSIVLYGRNASGKSNILLALKALSHLVENSDSFKHEEDISPYEPFRFDNKYKNSPIKFEIDFIAVEHKIRYKYIISYDASNIMYESLYFYPEGVKAKLYERVGGKITYGEYYRGTKKKIEDDLLPNQLFLSKSSTSKVKYLDQVYLYFKNYIHVSVLHGTAYDESVLKKAYELLLNDEKLKYNLLELLKAADTSILSFNIIESEVNISSFSRISKELQNAIKEKYKYRVLTEHSLYEDDNEIGTTTLGLEHESLGTKKIFGTGSLILEALEKGSIIVIDELDKGLHPLLTKLIIELFNNKDNNPKNAQLIFATHDSTLLDTEIFRRDQICFVDKDYQGGSIFYKLSDIKGVRKDVPIDKWYLSGRFKAIPVISEVELTF